MDKILNLLKDGKPRSSKEIARDAKLSLKSVWRSLNDYWKKGLILRTEKPIYEATVNFKGRAGIIKNTRGFYLYMIRPKGRRQVFINGQKFVSYDEKYLDIRAVRKKSKAKIILDFLEENKDKAFYSTEIAEALKDEGIIIRDVMCNLRRYEKKGLVYIRGYRTHEGQTPFKEGYLITWIDQDKDRDKALAGAVERTNKALAEKASTSPIVERVRRIRDEIITSTKLKELVSFTYLWNKLGCSEYEAENAVRRALQLYPDLKVVRLFGLYNYYYHKSMSPEDLRAAVLMNENYIRVIKGAENRMGHNWEACVEWFIDKFTQGAQFMTQSHRTKMDPRRITIHLIKSVGDRRRNAEVDRVWSITPGPLLQPTTYVLECKWGLVSKRHIDDFFEVLRWSKEFGVDTANGREIRQGVIGVFAGSTFNPKEKVNVNDELVDLPTYAARLNIQILKASDLNRKLRDKGCEITVQKICKSAANEEEVKKTLDAIWEKPEDARKIWSELIKKNKELYEFERMLQNTKNATTPTTKIQA
jgi:DNA-binding Lrp family transcriptional regulator